MCVHVFNTLTRITMKYNHSAHECTHVRIESLGIVSDKYTSKRMTKNEDVKDGGRGKETATEKEPPRV